MKSYPGKRTSLLTSFVAIGLSLTFSLQASAHCDGIDGPVVGAAQEALAKGDVNLVLIWVRKGDEAEIRRAFARTASVRKLSPQARELADTYFFETLVRIHRAGEGASFTGLKPAGRDLGPAIPSADEALKTGDVAPLTNLLVDKVREGVSDRHRKAMAARAYQPGDVAGGREYIEAYVSYIHYVEGIHDAAGSPAAGHYPEPAIAPHDGK